MVSAQSWSAEKQCLKGVGFRGLNSSWNQGVQMLELVDKYHGGFWRFSSAVVLALIGMSDTWRHPCQLCGQVPCSLLVLAGKSMIGYNIRGDGNAPETECLSS